MPISPNVYIKEHDRSFYTGSSTYVNGIALVFGFTSKGRDGQYEYIMDIDEFTTLFGTPTNEFESITYTTVKNVTSAGGVALVCRLPYSIIG